MIYGQRKDNDYYRRKINELRTTIENQRALITNLEKENIQLKKERERLDIIMYGVRKELERIEIALHDCLASKR